MLAFKKLTRCLNLVFPARQALDYLADYQALTEINVLVGKHFRELRLTGFWESIPARNKLKAELLRTLLAEEFSTLPGIVTNRAHIISRIIEIAEPQTCASVRRYRPECPLRRR